MIGTSLNQYRITASIGAGGMGEVYRARDTRLNRDVAVKVLPKDFAADADRLRRFEQEAKTLAALNHPNVLTVFDAGVHEGAPYLVSELLEGKTLREVLGSTANAALPVRKATDYALQIALGLAAAHDKGVIHRDLKPENIFVTKDGRVKILDFGLAKLKVGRVAPRAPLDNGNLLGGSQGTASPTTAETSTVVQSVTDTTEPGMVLGTPAYMSPEQVRGEPADHRADIFAFGCVLYEMLSGTRAFRRDTPVASMNAVLSEEPPEIGSINGGSRALDRIVRRCLEKQTERRFQSASDLAFALDGLSESNAGAFVREATATTWLYGRVGGARYVWIGLLAVLLFGFATVAWKYSRGRTLSLASSSPPNLGVTRSSIKLSTNAPLAFGDWNTGFESPLIAIAPDGQEVSYVAKTAEGTQLYRRALDGWEVRPLPNTSGAIHSFYSPDGQSLGFLTSDKIKKIMLRDESVQELCNVRSPLRAFWTRDGWIYAVVDEGVQLARVSSNGGALETSMMINGWAKVSQVLPDGRAALLINYTNGIRADYADISVFDLRTRQAKALNLRGYDVRYAASGHLIFSRDASLYAAPFDLDRLALSGSPIKAVAGVTMNSLFAQTQVSVSENGTLVYVPGGDLSYGRIAWVDRQGKSGFLENISERIYNVFDLSSDDKRLAIQVGDVDDYVWVYEFASQQGRKVTSAPISGFPRWKPQGSAEIVYESKDKGHNRILSQMVDGSSPPTELFQSPLSASVGSATWSPSEDLAVDGGPDGTLSVSLLRRQNGRVRLEPLVASGWGPCFSPDGQWVAFTSQVSGQYEIWLVAVSDKTLTRQISSTGGMEPIWLPNGDLYWRWRTKWFVTRVTTQPQLQWTTPSFAFETDFIDTVGVSYDISSDGQRLYVVKRTRQPVTDEIRVVQNWFEELKRLAPTGERQR